MRRNKILYSSFLALILLTLLAVSIITQNKKLTSTSALYLPTALVSDKANRLFTSSIANGVDLNSGITMERAISVDPNQINDISFSVFNHTDEDIVFPNQGFGITMYAYEDAANDWVTLPLTPPYSQSQTLPAKLETWDTDINNIWVIFGEEITNQRYKQFRLYVSGNGIVTNKTYGAYLDVMFVETP